MVHFSRATLRFDGACQPNPGEGGAGYILTNDNNGRVILQGRFYVGNDCTNNVAEYFGLVKGLIALSYSNHTVEQLDIEGDSELVIRQMKDNYRVNSRRLRPLKNKAKKLLDEDLSEDVNVYCFRHISRDTNARADTLAREAIQNGKNWYQDNY